MSEQKDELDPPFEILEPPDWRGPIVFNSPHSGSVYPRAFLSASRNMQGRFADAVISELSEADIDAFETLSEVPDPELYAWLSGGRPVPAEYDMAMFRRLRDFHLGGTV